MSDTIQEMVCEEDTQKGKFLTFSVGEEIFGIEIQYVTEIIGIQQITSLPEVPEYIKGVINLRGKIVPVIDVRIKFKKESIQYTDRTCIIVIDTEEITVGLIVDKVAEVLNLDDDNIVEPPNQRVGIENKYIQGIGKYEEQVILLLECNKLLNKKESNEINKISMGE